MKHRSREQDKKLADDAWLLRAWKTFHREELAQALAGPHGPMLERLMHILKDLASSQPVLLAFVRGVDWREIAHDVRFIALHEINTAITKLRERNGLCPFDDGVPGERDNAFRVVKAILLAEQHHDLTHEGSHCRSHPTPTRDPHGAGGTARADR